MHIRLCAQKQKVISEAGGGCGGVAVSLVNLQVSSATVDGGDARDIDKISVVDGVSS
jgi:hypothetical protein